MPKGVVIVISAPSGAGKSTLSKEICQRLSFCRTSVSCTTRPPRPGEKEGVDYFFMSEQEFTQKAAHGEFIEWAFVHGHNYGTPRGPLEKTLEEGHDVILNIDVQGGVKIRELYPDGLFVFVTPSDLKMLEERLFKRGQDSKNVIADRLLAAKKELVQMRHYDYLVINDNLGQAVDQLEAIIIAEHQKVKRLSHIVEQFQRTVSQGG